MSGTYVFVGPTLSVADARAELDAVYLPPVSAGDIYRLWPRRPRAIGVIDGVLGDPGAVWHKEIMWIMEQGVHVFGSASLGALRAAELDAFGMRGVGLVYQAVKAGDLGRDDEVLVAHAGPAEEYRATSVAMVDIRATLRSARSDGIISDATLTDLTTAGAAIFYRERTWGRLLDAATTSGCDPAAIDALRAWLPSGRIDQQAADAVVMLGEMRRFLATNPEPQRVSWTMAMTSRWADATRYADSADGERSAESVLVLGALLDEIRLLGPGTLEAARNRSLLRVLAVDAAERRGLILDDAGMKEAVAEFRRDSHVEQDADFAEFLSANGLSAADCERMVGVAEKVRWACERVEPAALDDLIDDLRMRGAYGQLMSRATEKLRSHSTLKLNETTPDETGPDQSGDSDQLALSWYFGEKMGTTAPDDLAAYARSCGFSDEHAFRAAVHSEYQYARSS
jgi:hypothetical protein